jgi:hypothetical protein
MDPLCWNSSPSYDLGADCRSPVSTVSLPANESTWQRRIRRLLDSLPVPRLLDISPRQHHWQTARGPAAIQFKPHVYNSHPKPLRFKPWSQLRWSCGGRRDDGRHLQLTGWTAMRKRPSWAGDWQVEGGPMSSLQILLSRDNGRSLSFQAEGRNSSRPKTASPNKKMPTIRTNSVESSSSASSAASSVLEPPLSPSKRMFQEVREEHAGPHTSRVDSQELRDSAGPHASMRRRSEDSRGILHSLHLERGSKCSGARGAPGAAAETTPLKLSAAAACASAARAEQRVHLTGCAAAPPPRARSTVAATRTAVVISQAALHAQHSHAQHRLLRSASRLHFSAGYAEPSVPAAKGGVDLNRSAEAHVAAEMAEMAAASCLFRGQDI